MQDFVGFPHSVAWRGPGHLLCGQRRKCLLILVPFSKVPVLRACSRTLSVLLESVLLVTFAISEERQMCLCKHQEKGGSVWAVFFPGLSVWGRAAQEAVLHRDAACWHIAGSVYVKWRYRCCNDVSKRDATYQGTEKRKGLSEEEKCVTLFTRSMPGAISVASNSPMSSKDRIRNQCFDPDISELFWLHTAPRLNFFKTFMSLPLLPDTLFVLIFSGIMSPCW